MSKVIAGIETDPAYEILARLWIDVMSVELDEENVGETEEESS